MDYDTANEGLNQRIRTFENYLTRNGLWAPACFQLAKPYGSLHSQRSGRGWVLVMNGTTTLARDASVDAKVSVVMVLPDFAKHLAEMSVNGTAYALEAFRVFDASDIAKEMARGRPGRE